jgi:hypothetical protein
LPAGGPNIRRVNTKRITINYEVSSGTAGSSGVHLWCTRDTQTWVKYPMTPFQKNAYLVEVPQEGLYGFSLMARRPAGQVQLTPRAGDQPQMWVAVDETRPVVRFGGAEVNRNGQNVMVMVHWSASDMNFGARPISLSCSESPGGPWEPIASGLENNGHFAWQVPPNAPRRLYFRVEAIDLMNNLGMAVGNTPVMLDGPWSAATANRR